MAPTAASRRGGPADGEPATAGPATTSPRHGPAETTPLLKGGSSSSSSGSSGSGSGDGTSSADADDEVTVLAAETSGTRLALTLGTAYVGVFLGAVDGSVMATLSGPIASEFRALGLLSWLATAYLVANAACQPLSGRLTDVFGRGPGLVFSNVLFAAGNLVCGVARSEGVVIAGRVVAGVGGGGLMSISTFLASDLVPLRKRGVVQGIGNIAYGSGAMLGGVFGGLINDMSSWGWRLAFLIQVPVSIVSAVLVLFLVKVPPKLSNKSLISRIDFTGGFLIVSFLVLLLLGLNAGGNVVPWSHPLVLVTIPLSLVILVGLIWWESRAGQPIIPVRLLTERTVFAACMANLMCTMVMMMTVFYIPLYMQVLGYSSTKAALPIVASAVSVSVASVGSGYIMKRTGKYVGLGISVVLVLTAGVACLTALDDDPSAWLPFAAMALVGGGYGAMLTVTLLACIAAVDHSQQAVVTSATYAFRSVGATVGITAASAVYQNILRARLWARFGHLPGAAEAIARITDDLAELRRLPDGWGEGVVASFVEAFRGVWLTGLAIALVGLVCISLMKQHKLHSNLAREDD